MRTMDEKLVCVYKPENEYLALSLKQLLEDEEIPAVIESEQIPWYDNIMATAKGYWGKLLVSEDKEEEASKIIDIFLEDK